MSINKNDNFTGLSDKKELSLMINEFAIAGFIKDLKDGKLAELIKGESPVLYIVEKRSGNRYELDVNSKGDICYVTREGSGKSLKLFFMEAGRFEMASESALLLSRYAEKIEEDSESVSNVDNLTKSTRAQIIRQAEGINGLIDSFSKSFKGNSSNSSSCKKKTWGPDTKKW